MKITEECLQANGWRRGHFITSADLRKNISARVTLFFTAGRVYLSSGMYESVVPLPNVTTMEQLAQLEYLLSPYRIVNSAPIDAAIAATFGGEK